MLLHYIQILHPFDEVNPWVYRLHIDHYKVEMIMTSFDTYILPNLKGTFINSVLFSPLKHSKNNYTCSVLEYY